MPDLWDNPLGTDGFDEMLFYHAGDFFSRDGIDAGMVTLHPAGHAT